MSNFAEAFKDVAEVMKAQEDELAGMMSESVGNVPSLPSFPPRLLELISILQANPILIPPMLELVKLKQAEIMNAQGEILYGKERWEAMKAAASNQG